jgi:protein O-GlcNAc transferase
MGFPGTMGADFIDYFIGDSSFTVCPEGRALFTEKILYMPHSYQANSYAEMYSEILPAK